MSSYFADTKTHSKDAVHDAKLAASDAKAAARSAFTELKAIPSMAVPPFSDIAKPANDVRSLGYWPLELPV